MEILKLAYNAMPGLYIGLGVFFVVMIVGCIAGQIWLAKNAARLQAKFLDEVDKHRTSNRVGPPSRRPD